MNKRERTEKLIDVARLYSYRVTSAKAEADLAEDSREVLVSDFISDKLNADKMRLHLFMYADALERLAGKAAQLARNIHIELECVSGGVGTKAGIKEEDEE